MRVFLCPARNFQQRALATRALNDRKPAAEPPRDVFVSGPQPTRARALSPDVIQDCFSIT